MSARAPTVAKAQVDSDATGLRARLAADLEAAAALPGIDATALAALRGKFAGRLFNLVVAGEFKRGKSSTINALLGADVLPTGVVPLTSIVTILRHGSPASARVCYEHGRCETVAVERIADYVTERANPKNVKRVREVEVTYPAPWLGHGFRLVDTPGIGSAYSHNTEVTRAYLPEADAVIFVASVEQPVSQSELDFLTGIRAWAGRIFCLLNKTDFLSEAELAESVAFATATLRDALGRDVPVFPVSARLALQARAAGAEDRFEASGFAKFDTALRHFFANDSGAVWVASIHRHLLRLLSECRLAAELELRATEAPLETLEANLAAFAARKAEAIQTRSDFEALLNADAHKLITDRVDPDIQTFQRELAERLAADVPAWLADAESQHASARHVALQQRIVAEIRDAFDAWRVREDDGVSDAFDTICGRFQQRVQQTADELLQYSAELFSIDFDAIVAEPFRQARSGFYYKFWQEPTSLTMMREALGDLVPGAFGRALLLKRARRRTAELVDTQSGRVHYDIAQRVDGATQAARRDLLRRLDATIASVEAAIDRGRALKSRGEDVVAERRQDIESQLARIEALTAHALTVDPPGR
ncbi:MAG: dynamin family protein [Rhodanobacteraceae bacterium]